MAIRRINRSTRPEQITRRDKSRGMNYYCFGVNYENSPDVYEYFFRAKTVEEVSRATGVDLEYISECSLPDIQSAIKRGRHIDTIVHGRLIEEV